MRAYDPTAGLNFTIDVFGNVGITAHGKKVEGLDLDDMEIKDMNTESGTPMKFHSIEDMVATAVHTTVVMTMFA